MSLLAEILPTHTPELFEAAVERAAQSLRAGEVVALPTETVYGLAANALDIRAVKRIFQIKNRPARNPIIVHVASRELAQRCVAAWPSVAEKLAKSFWPGPLTLVLPRAKHIPEIVTAGGGTLAVRWPSHPFIQAVIRACGFPLAAPSANPSGQVSPTNAEHVRKSLGTQIRLIVDGGPSQIGIESTVLDLTASPARLLRPGMIHQESLVAVTGGLTVGFGDSSEVLKSPGLLPKHYAPKAKLVIWSWANEAELRQELAGRNWPLDATHIIAYNRIPSAAGFGRVSVIPHDARAFARAIYAELHRCDELEAQFIIVEALPRDVEWQGLADRLIRAAS